MPNVDKGRAYIPDTYYTAQTVTDEKP